MAANSSATLINPIKRRQHDELALGLIIRIASSGGIASIAKTSGFDFLFIDMQHAIYSLETMRISWMRRAAANSRRVGARTLSACS